MAISSENYKDIYAGDDTSTVFPYTFKIFAQTEIEVIKYTIADGTQTVLTLGADYSVSGEGVDAGGNVTLTSPLLDEFDLILRRKLPYKQETDWEQNGDFSTDVLEEVEDRAVMLILQVKEQIDRMVLQDPSKTTQLTLPIPSAGKGLKWNATADGLENTTVDADAAAVSAAASVAAALISKNAADADAVQTAADRVQTGLDKIATAADRVQTGLDKTAADGDAVATAADRVQTGLDRTATGGDKIATAADRVQTGLDVIAAANYAAALKATSTSSIAIGTGSKTFVTQAGKQFATGQFILITSDADPTNYMHGQVTSYSTTSLVVNVLDIGGSGTHTDWTIDVSGSRGATGPAGDNDKVKNVSADASAGYLAEKLAALYPSLYQRDQKWVLKTAYSTAANRYTLLTPNKLSVDINGTVYFLTAQAEIALSLEANWDTIAGTDYRTAANRAGKDFYIYACVPVSGSAPKIVLSANSTTPSGYSASTSRKIGGFHGLCVAVGTISGHTLTDFVAGDVLPASIWDLNFKPKFANPEGMVYSDGINKWVDIYLASGTGASTVSVYGGTISDTRNWMDFVDDGGAVKKKMLADEEFQVIAAGSNEETNINGSGDPGTTGGHIDTGSRRMISNIGVEDCVGAMWQWLLTQSYFYTGTTGYYGNLPGAKGSYYTNFASDPGAGDPSSAGSDVKLLAGGNWADAAAAGSRSRNAPNSRWHTHSSLGCRFCAEPV